MGEPGNGKPDIRLIAVNDKGLYLEAVGTVDGVEVSAPFLAMLELGEKELAATAAEHVPDAARMASVAKVESDIKAWRSKEVNRL